jgi:hypothetical protein
MLAVPQLKNGLLTASARQEAPDTGINLTDIATLKGDRNGKR